MEHALRMRVDQRPRDVERDPERVGHREPPTPEPRGERLPVEELEDEIRPRLAPAVIVQADEILVLELGRHLGLLQRPGIQCPHRGAVP